jgi:hypothetical protein
MPDPGGEPMKIFSAALVLLLTLPVIAAGQTISGHVYDHHGDPLSGITVAYNLGGAVQQDTTDATGSYFLNFDASGVPDLPGPRVQGTTWGRLKIGFKDLPEGHGKAAARSQTTIFPDTLYFLGGTNYWSNTHPLPAPSGTATVDMALPPTVYSDIPTEGPFPINTVLTPNVYYGLPAHTEGVPIDPLDYADYHDLLNAPIDPKLVPNSTLWHPSRIQAKLKVQIDPQWNQTQRNVITQTILPWLEENMNVRGVYGMPTIYELVPWDPLGGVTVGVQRIIKGSLFGAEPQVEMINGEYFVKHMEITLQYASSTMLWYELHEVNHGNDGMIAHVDSPTYGGTDGYDGDGLSLMNGSPNQVAPADKAYQKLAYQLQKLRLVDDKHDGFECFYCLR